MNKLVPITIFLVIILLGGYFLYNKSLNPSLQNSNQQTVNIDGVSFTFDIPKKSAHYETNTPKHEEVLAGVPINVVIDFNFDLAVPSEIKIEKDGTDYGVGETVIDQNKLSMRRVMDPDSSDGLYKVNYNACWPDGSCHDGYFQFAIDTSTASSFSDLTGQSEVTIDMTDIKFMPMNIKISKGTTITWVNNDNITHYVNTDSHPAHTYYPDQNSRALEEGDSYSVSFNTAGIYPYHCSAHADSMVGSILVE